MYVEKNTSNLIPRKTLTGVNNLQLHFVNVQEDKTNQIKEIKSRKKRSSHTRTQKDTLFEGRKGLIHGEMYQESEYTNRKRFYGQTRKRK